MITYVVDIKKKSNANKSFFNKISTFFMKKPIFYVLLDENIFYILFCIDILANKIIYIQEKLFLNNTCDLKMKDNELYYIILFITKLFNFNDSQRQVTY